MKVVIRSVEVGRHDSYIVGAVLEIEGFAHLQTSYLSYGIGLVCVFERRCQQTVFGHGLGSIARVDACRAEEEQFLHPVFPCFADDVLLYLQILIDEVSAILEVCHDATDVGCCQHYRIGLFGIEECLDGDGVEKVELRV